MEKQNKAKRIKNISGRSYFESLSEEAKKGKTFEECQRNHIIMIDRIKAGETIPFKIELNESGEAYNAYTEDGFIIGAIRKSDLDVEEGQKLEIIALNKKDYIFDIVTSKQRVAKNDKIIKELLDETLEKAREIGMPLDDAKERLTIMVNEYGLKKDEAKAVIDYWKSPSPEIASYIPDVSKIIYQDTSDGHFYRVLGYICGGMKALRLVGAMSTGKNVFIESLASLCYRPLLEVDMQRNTEGVDFIGDNTLTYKIVGEKFDKKEMFDAYENCVNKGKFRNINMSDFTAATLVSSAFAHKGETPVQCIEFVKQPLTLAMQYGGWINFNELNFAQPHVLSLLHRVLDTRASIHVPGLGEIKAHEDFVFMSTMNPPKMGYAGTNTMNEAFESRLTTVLLPPTTSIKNILIKKYPNKDRNEISVLDNIYKAAYQRNLDGDLPEGFLALRCYEAALNNVGFGSFKNRIIDHLASITINDEDGLKNMHDIIEMYVE